MRVLAGILIATDHSKTIVNEAAIVTDMDSLVTADTTAVISMEKMDRTIIMAKETMETMGITMMEAITTDVEGN